MTEKQPEPNHYDHWLRERRDLRLPENLTEQIMDRVTEWDDQRQQMGWLILVERIERSRMARWALCGGALTVGGLPFLFLAYVAKFLTF